MNYKKITRLIKPLINEIKKISQVKAIVYYGSLGRNQTDKYSDVDIACFCVNIPKNSVRKKLLKKIGAREKSETMNINAFYFYKIEIILWFKPIKEINTILKRFSGKDVWVQNEIDTWIDKTKIICDPKGIFRKWKKKIRYPKWIQKRMINEIQFIHSIFEFIETSVRRRNYIWIDKFLEDRIDTLIRIIYALNKEYYSSQKWFYKDVKKFKIKPKNCLSRIEKIKGLDNRKQLAKKLKLLNDFCEDLYKLTRKKYPEFKPVYDYEKRNQLINQISKVTKVIKK